MKNSLKENMTRFATKNLAEQSTLADIENAIKINMKQLGIILAAAKKPGTIDNIDNNIIVFINGKIYQLV